MTKRMFFALFVLMLSYTFASAQHTFVAEGPEKQYNQIRVVNETSQENFQCRVVVLDENDSLQKVYGVYNLNEKGDADSNTDKFPRGTKFGIQMPKNFPVEVDFMIEYKDIPLFDILIIHLYDKGSFE